MSIDVRRSADRALTRTPWLESRHSFSFGPHYDPANTHFGLLVAHNEDTVAPGAGFDPHPHRDMEILTWVLDGELAHHDSAGHSGLVYPGLAQRMSAGAGIVHSERNASAAPVHFVQTWLTPDADDLAPGYAQEDVAGALGSGQLVPVASGRHDAAIRLHQRDATFSVARFQGTVDVPDAPFVHVFLARGAGTLEDVGDLEAGDAVRLTDGGPRRMTGAGEILVWAMHSGLGG